MKPYLESVFNGIENDGYATSKATIMRRFDSQCGGPMVGRFLLPLDVARRFFRHAFSGLYFFDSAP
jgi:hypothetical protein